MSVRYEDIVEAVADAAAQGHSGPVLIRNKEELRRYFENKQKHKPKEIEAKHIKLALPSDADGTVYFCRKDELIDVIEVFLEEILGYRKRSPAG